MKSFLSFLSVQTQVCLIILIFSCLPLYSQSYLPYCLVELDEDPNLRLSIYELIDSLEWREANHVSGCRINLYKYKKGILSAKSSGEASYKFAKDGNLTEAILNKGKSKIVGMQDAEGTVLRTMLLGSNDELLMMKSFGYDSLGRITSLEFNNPKYQLNTVYGIGYFDFFNSPDKSLFIFKYNEQGKLEDMTAYSGSANQSSLDKNPFYQEGRSYNEAGDLSEVKVCINNGSMTDQILDPGFSEIECNFGIKNTYNEKGDLTKIDIYKPEIFFVSFKSDKPQGYINVINNESGQIRETQEFDANNHLLYKTFFEYDSRGNMTHYKKMDVNPLLAWDSIICTISQTFNEHNQLLKRSYSNKQYISMSAIYGFNYDERGVKTEIIEYDYETEEPQKHYKLTYY